MAEIIVNSTQATCQNCQIGRRVNAQDIARSVDVVIETDLSGQYTYVPTSEKCHFKQSEINCWLPCPLGLFTL